MAAHTTTLAWRIPKTEEPGGLIPWVTKWETAERLSTARLHSEYVKQAG